MGINETFVSLFRGFIGPVPTQVVIALAVAGIGAFILNRTTVGRVAQALGGNEDCVRISGGRTTLYKLVLYTLTGMLAATGGLVLTSMMAVAEPIAGLFYELDAVAVVVMGGTLLSGGFGTIFGTLLGAALLGIVRNGLNMLGISAIFQQLIIGLIIMLAVIAGSRRRQTVQW